MANLYTSPGAEAARHQLRINRSGREGSRSFPLTAAGVISRRSGKCERPRLRRIYQSIRCYNWAPGGERAALSRHRITLLGHARSDDHQSADAAPATAPTRPFANQESSREPFQWAPLIANYSSFAVHRRTRVYNPRVVP